MQASLRYISNRAPPAAIPGQPLLSTFSELEASQATQTTQASQATQSGTHQDQPPAASIPTGPATQEEFSKDIRELSRDLVLKEQQIEVLIASLPGLNASEKEQVDRMKELERELEGLEGERKEAMKERETLLKNVDEIIGRVGGQNM
jgi:mediator of RNA polymerase II transcription subunit 21